MITIWKTPIVATVEQVLKDLKLQLYGAGLLKEIKNTGSDLMCTCPFHANGKEHNPSCGVLLQQKVTNSEVRRYMEECLFENEHITGVQDLEVSQIKDVLHIKFTLVTDVGSKEVEMDV